MNSLDVVARLMAEFGLPQDDETLRVLAADLDPSAATSYDDVGLAPGYLTDVDLSETCKPRTVADLSPDTLPTTLLEAMDVLHARSLSSEELTSAAIRSAEHANAKLGVYVSERWQQCLESAIRTDSAPGIRDDVCSLRGIPMAVKDNIFMTGTVTTAQSMVLPQTPGTSDADVVSRLRHEHALILGKTSMGEFAVGLPDETQPFPYPRNPWDLARYPGGSSSGSGIGVAAGFFYAALGTDTAGSVRMPAALCGVSGLKPTHGVLPTAGTVPLAPSLDTVGVLARAAADCAVVAWALSPGPPETLDAWVRHRLRHRQRARMKLDDFCIAYDDTLLHSPLADPSAVPAFQQLLSTLAGAGARLMRVRLPLTKELHEASMAIMRAEGFHQHRRLLGKHWQRYTPSARTELLRGALVSRSAYAGAHATRSRGVASIREALHGCSCVITPTMSIGAPPLPEVTWQITDTMLTSVWNATGAPAISVPIGFTTAGLPLGAQIAAGPFEESVIIEVADCFQELTDWHLRRPGATSDVRSQGGLNSEGVVR